jgi:GNAT superfamily N-acetyltransferase
LLRQATVADIAAMHRVRLTVRENVLSNPARVTEAHYLAAINERGRGWVIEAKGEIVAFAFGDATDGSIWALFVDLGHEGKGYGKQLQAVMLDWLWAQGLQRLWLTTARGSRAEQFYGMTGWQAAGITPDGDARFEMDRPVQ